ncbi:hypothetical protein Q8A67_024211 [Cirrhinus molitorella]|uniref:Uncharacterized protein n=1 Tax=Cirrhinus molitorella TaxID=172907 RepID=A0AA88P4J7_9TELE|nr:hypothetical protein Q8A67_024211 [Cirrhinus molitorella]
MVVLVSALVVSSSALELLSSAQCAIVVLSSAYFTLEILSSACSVLVLISPDNSTLAPSSARSPSLLPLHHPPNRMESRDITGSEWERERGGRVQERSMRQEVHSSHSLLPGQLVSVIEDDILVLVQRPVSLSLSHISVGPEIAVVALSMPSANHAPSQTQGITKVLFFKAGPCASCWAGPAVLQGRGGKLLRACGPPCRPPPPGQPFEGVITVACITWVTADAVRHTDRKRQRDTELFASTALHYSQSFTTFPNGTARQAECTSAAASGPVSQYVCGRRERRGQG